MNTTTQETVPATSAAIEANRLWLTLEALDLDVQGLRDRVAGLQDKQRHAAGAAERAAAPLRDYYEQLGAGERDPDPELEVELQRQAREAQANVTIRPRAPRGGGHAGVDVVDERIEAELAGATRALERAELNRASWLSRNLQGLAAEVFPRTLRARDEFDAQWAELREAEREWTAVLRKWDRIRDAASVPVEAMPANPLRGVSHEIDAGVPLPMPASMVPEQ